MREFLEVDLLCLVATAPAVAAACAIFLKGAWMPSIAEELATDVKTARARKTGSRR